MEKVKIGVAGCGSVSQRGLLPHLSQDDITDRVELAAVMDVVTERAKASAAKFGARLWFDDYDEMLASDIDAVVIASPIGYHYEQGMKAIQAGKHIHFNKTMTTTKAEADEVIQAAQTAEVVIVASPGQMQWPINKTVKHLLEEGAVGKVYFAVLGRSWIGHEYEGFRSGESALTDVNPLWYYRKQAGGGPMYDMAVYALHDITGILGPVQRVSALSGIGLKQREYMGERVEVDIDDNTFLLLDFGEATFAVVWGTNSSGAGSSPNLRISGSSGAVEVSWREGIKVYGDPALHGLPGAQLTVPVQFTLPYVSGVHDNLQEKHVYSDIMHMVDCVLTGGQPVVTAEHARHVIEIIELGYASAQSGLTQTLTTTF
jgi:predicted dehydrogenase